MRRWSLGRLDPEQFLGGDLTIDAGLAREAIEEHIAEPLGMSVTTRRSAS